MKKLTYILILLFIPLSISAQEMDILDRHEIMAYDFSEMISSEINGLILEQGHSEVDGINYAFTKLELDNTPGYIRRAVDRFTDSYSDVVEIRPWFVDDGGQFYQMALVGDGVNLESNYTLSVLLAYVPENDLMGIYVSSFHIKE